MAHNFTSGCFTTRAWHNLGTVLDKALPAKEMFKIAEADYDVSLEPIYVGGKPEPVNGFKALMHGRTDEILTIVSDDYKLIPNAALLEFAQAVEKYTNLEAVCVLGGGRRVAFTATLNSIAANVGKGDDPLTLKLNGFTGHDGVTAFGGMFTPVRIVCDNTLSLAQHYAQNSGRQLRIAHKGNPLAMIKRLPEIIDFGKQQFTATVEELEAMAEHDCNAELFKRMLEITFEADLRRPINDVRGDKSTERQRTVCDIPGYDQMCNNFEGDMPGGNTSGTTGTLYQAYNAITAFYRHSAYKGGKNGDERRYGSLLFGKNHETIKKAHAAALELTKA